MARARRSRRRKGGLEERLVAFVNSFGGMALIAGALLGWHYLKKQGKLPASAPDIEIPELPKNLF